MAITKRWAGKAWGTNIGELFLKLEGEDGALTGTLRMNEQGVGIAVYAVQGIFDAPTLTLTGQSQIEVEDVEFGELTATGTLNAQGELRGDWETTIGSAGTFALFPHVGAEPVNELQRAEQFHIARHDFGAIEIDQQQVAEIGDIIRQEFPAVIVTVVAGTEQARYLEDFKQTRFSADKAQIIKIHASKNDGAGYNQTVTIEFGPQVNSVITQGANEAWVLGKRETLKRELKRFERTYVTNFKRWGIGINQFMLLAAVVFLPSLSGLRDRAILMGAVLALAFGVNWTHSRYFPFAAIYLREKKRSFIGRLWASIASWVVGIAAAVVAALVGAYLQGWLEIPSPPSAPVITAPAPELPATPHKD